MIELERSVRELSEADADVGLYLLIQAAGDPPEYYSAQHSLLCALICDVCAKWKEWPENERLALIRAALTMNLGMAALQDQLARQAEPLTPEQREQVDGHAEASVERLKSAGVEDPLWLEIVLKHAQDRPPQDKPDSDDGAPGERLAAMLRRIDVFAAKLSRRAGRTPMSPAIAARDAFLDLNGKPDAIGATMLRCLGLYPPGTFVILSNDETGVVVRRGAKAHTPIVASLRRADGGMLAQPARRTIGADGFVILRGLSAEEAKCTVVHRRVLSA